MGKYSDLKTAVATKLESVAELAGVDVIAYDTKNATKLKTALQKVGGLCVIVSVSRGEIPTERASLPSPSLASVVSVAIWSNPLLLHHDQSDATAASSSPLGQTRRDPDDVLEACLIALHGLALSVPHVGAEDHTRHKLEVEEWAIIDSDPTHYVQEILCSTNVQL